MEWEEASVSSCSRRGGLHAGREEPSHMLRALKALVGLFAPSAKAGAATAAAAKPARLVIAWRRETAAPEAWGGVRPGLKASEERASASIGWR